MSSNFRYPNVTGTTDRAKLEQIQSYLHQLVDQLNYSLNKIEGNGSVATASTSAVDATKEKKNDANTTFKSIKSLIIKSADIVNEVINNRLSGIYVAESDFGAYAEQTASQIAANSSSVEQFYTNLQEIITNIESLEHSLIEVNAHIYSGLLYYDEDSAPVYGLEIGQRTEIDGVEVFHKYARFTSDRLSFYDQNDNEVAYISDRKLFITHIEVTGSYRIGSLVDTTLSDGSVVTRYVANGGDG